MDQENLYVIYVTGEDVDIRLPSLILSEEGLPYTVIISVERVMKLTQGRVNPAYGWVVYHNNEACEQPWPYKWHQLADLIIKRGEIRC